MRFQGLAVVLGKDRWPELVAQQRKHDYGLDAYAPPSQTKEGVGKGLAASITPTLSKISKDAKRAKDNFQDLEILLFVTAAKVGNADRKSWEKAIRDGHDLELILLEGEEIITLLMMPQNAALNASFLLLHSDLETPVADLIKRTRRAAAAVTDTWARKLKGRPLMELVAVRLDTNGAESTNTLSLPEIELALSQSRRIVLEGPAGRGKTTSLIQIAQRTRDAGTAFIVELPAWTSSGQSILDYIAGMSPFQAEGLSAVDLAKVQQSEPFMFLMNGWNEISESISAQADTALRELERNFPSAGIIVATRTHQLTPPLLGALRLRLLRPSRERRAQYLSELLGAKSAVLRARIECDASLDDLTRSPYVLSAVVSLFEAGAEIPTTKLGVLERVLHLQEQRGEHRNPLQGCPIFGRQEDYLKALATDMTMRGGVSLPEADARSTVAAVMRELVEAGQVEQAGTPGVLSMLTAHHVLERVDYPKTTFQFEHQQLQEYYAALDVHERLLTLSDGDEQESFVRTYVNDPSWSEPLRMIAEDMSVKTGNTDTDELKVLAGERLVNMALSVDLLFAGELAQLCGPVIWNRVRTKVCKKLREVHAASDVAYREYAVAAMLATGTDDFADIIVPLLSNADQQVRLSAYRLWRDTRVFILGDDWQERVKEWAEDARADFVSELLHERIDGDLAAFAAKDDSAVVKKAAALALMWNGSNEALIEVLESMEEQTFDEIALTYADGIPVALKPKVSAAMRRFVETAADNSARLRTVLELIKLGESGLDDVVKDALVVPRGNEDLNLSSLPIGAALDHLRAVDPDWVCRWVVEQVAEGALYDNERWLQFATTILPRQLDTYVDRIETEEVSFSQARGIAAVLAAGADEMISARIFAKIRELRRKADDATGVERTAQWKLVRQLEDAFRGLKDDIAAKGVLSSIEPGDPFDVEVAAKLLSRVARSDVEPLQITDEDVRERLRSYLKGSIDLVLRQDDFNGDLKADLASSLAQVGNSEDMSDMLKLIDADIERRRRGRDARARGEFGPLANGGSMSYARWHIAAVTYLDPIGADEVLIDLVSVPEYRTDAAAAMARDYLPKSVRPYDGNVRYERIWAVRGEASRPCDPRRIRFSEALNAEIKQLRALSAQGKPVTGLKELATALAAVDGRRSENTVMEEFSTPGEWNHYTCLDSAELLLQAGVVLPTGETFALVDSVIERANKSTQDSDRYLLRRALAICAFVDDPAAGIAKISDVLRERKFWGHELRELVPALGASRSDAAVELLHTLASDEQILAECWDALIDAIAMLDTQSAHKMLLGFVDPELGGLTAPTRLGSEDRLVLRLTEVARRHPPILARLLAICDLDLQERQRQILSKVLSSIDTAEALEANLSLIDDERGLPVPQGVIEQLERTFVPRQPYGREPNIFTIEARAANELRARLFRMSLEDNKRQRSAARLLGKIEAWRLDYGRPPDERRHPDLGSGQPWPPEMF